MRIYTRRPGYQWIRKYIKSLEEKKLIEEINKLGHYHIELVDLKNRLIKITNINGSVLEVDFNNVVYLRIMLSILKKQDFDEPIIEFDYSDYKLDMVLFNGRFEAFYANSLRNWCVLCETAVRHMTKHKKKNPYYAIIRLAKIGKELFIIENIDRDRKLWK